MKKTLIGAATWMATCLLSGPATAEVVPGTNLSVDFHAVMSSVPDVISICCGCQ